MASHTLLVPGTQASELRDQDDEIVYNPVRIGLGIDRDNLGGRLPPKWARLLSMEHRPGLWAPTRTSLEPGTELRATRVVRTPYDRLWKDVEPWPYDWRTDMRYNALALLRFLEENRPPVGERWNLVGHSQGGLVIVLASKLTRRIDDFARLVGRVVLVGAPLAGTLRALEALLPGRKDLGTKQIDATREMARTWPAIHQMLPSWDSVVGVDGAALPDARQFTEIGGYPAPWDAGMREDLLARARETQEMLQGPLAGMGPGVAKLVVMGDAQDTPVTVEWTADGGFACAQPRRDRDAPVPCRELDFGHESGDSLVPTERTKAWGGERFAKRCWVPPGDIRRHAMLCDDELVVKAIRKFLKRPAPTPPAQS